MENHKLSQLTDKTYTTILAMAKEALANEIQKVLAGEIATAPLFHRVAVPILSSSSSSETISPLNWLSAQENRQKVYWGDRDNLFESATIGECASFEIENLDERHQLVGKIEKLLGQSSDNIRFYGGMRFPSDSESGSNSEEWQAFGAAKFVLPRFELIRETGQTLFVCNLNSQTDRAAADKILSELESVRCELSGSEAAAQEFEVRTDLPLFDGWQSNVRAILDDFTRSKIEKIVLARRSIFEFKDNCNAFAIMKRLSKTTPNCFHFLFQPAKDISFLGASPERLYKRIDKSIESEAVAGTRRRGIDEFEDRNLGDELLSDDKEKREHQYVVQNIKAALESVCEKIEFDKTESLFKLARVQHLVTRFSGSLKENVTDSRILNLLHPTAAVGGFPSELAQKRISEYEPFDRGWYAGAIGWIGRDSAEFAVGIRSGLVKGKKLSLYSGAGIVKGSTPQREWDEIESKIGSFLNAVTG
ncbi:MAG: isochorismate synthase [candidate division Zixibacteria bacterium]|nr:isochorismate synthase [candidate division Zixibacteria bacterium]